MYWKIYLYTIFSVAVTQSSWEKSSSARRCGTVFPDQAFRDSLREPDAARVHRYNLSARKPHAPLSQTPRNPKRSIQHLKFIVQSTMKQFEQPRIPCMPSLPRIFPHRRSTLQRSTREE